MILDFTNHSGLFGGILGAASTSLGIILSVVLVDSLITAVLCAAAGTFMGVIVTYLTKKALRWLDKSNYHQIND